ncbi:hypothetical protein CNMCM7691_002506 [Aspergillus felis]|uniref:Polysaccharide export protein (CAP59) n=1 Tax=Aspergillus felis TaxID=1287682 RepID=A0A8H6QR44_9EURO|nr:hypothetical protein CNMCM7691_002506 [Aspergillus felis]
MHLFPPEFGPFLRHGLLRRYGPRRRLLQALLISFALWTVLEVVLIYQRVSTVDAIKPRMSQKPERIYIASMHWNNEAILRSHWNDAIIQLAKAWGSENVFVSVYESGSWDDTKGALRDLDVELDRLGVRRNITLSDTTHEDEIAASPSSEGWIDTPRGRKELRRIPYLARLRNLTLRPLEDLERRGITFDKILFLNDVVFTVRINPTQPLLKNDFQPYSMLAQVDDVIELLHTNDGVYAAACSLDYSRPPLYYDTFALRDSHGDEHVMQTWPYFRSTESRHALYNMFPVPVKSCWNGMVAMPIEPLVSSTPLRFRGIPDSLALFHLEGSECCLIHADNPLSGHHGVYLNPKVRVGYNGPAYEKVHPAGSWLSPQYIALALWENRFRRWATTTLFKKWVVQRRVAQWKALSGGRHEPGDFCLINEMQVLIANGWAHV